MKQLLILHNESLTVLQGIIIHHLATRGHTPGELATLLKLHHSTVANACVVLMEKGHARRNKEATFTYRLTEKGMNYAQRLLNADLPDGPTATEESSPLPGLFRETLPPSDHIALASNLNVR